MSVKVLIGDCREVLCTLPDESVHCVVTSPPYWGLRDYGCAGQIGLEPSYADFVAQMVAVFREVRRVLRKDGTLWLNLGDSYVSSGGTGHQGKHWQQCNRNHTQRALLNGAAEASNLKPKDLCGIPWRVAFALQADGWWLRQDIIWSKPNPMPESVTDRCTKAHEYIFLLSKSERYYFDQDAIAEAVTASTVERLSQPTLDDQEGSWRVPGKTNGAMKAVGRKPVSGDYGHGAGRNDGDNHPSGGFRGRASGNKTHKGVTEYECSDSEEHRTKAGLLKISDTAYPVRNRRSVWTVATQPFSEAHFATFPPALIEPCIKAGCPKGGTVLDPFGGAGTTGLVADRLGRNAILIELNPDYAAMAEHRIKGDAGMFAEVVQA
jgi:DNA modification methylase